MRRSCSVIICTKNRSNDMRECLDSLATQTRLPEELIVVDAGSDDTEAVVRDFTRAVPAVSVVHQRCEPGLTRQRNAGIRLARYDVIHFLDDDVILDTSYVEKIQEVFESDDRGDLVAVGPSLQLPRPFPKLQQRVLRAFMMPHLNGDGRMMPSGFGSLTWYSEFSDVHPIEVGCGCCTFRRDVFEHILYDEFFEGYGFMEDQEFSYRAGKLGRMLGTPHAKMLHVESAGARTNFRRLAAMQIKNHFYVFKKHIPQDTYHWFCFWWSEFGYTMLRLVAALRGRSLGVIAGTIEGYWTLLTGRGPRPNRTPGSLLGVGAQPPTS